MFLFLSGLVIGAICGAAGLAGNLYFSAPSLPPETPYGAGR
jgi:hypothetical protein